MKVKRRGRRRGAVQGLENPRNVCLSGGFQGGLIAGKRGENVCGSFHRIWEGSRIQVKYGGDSYRLKVGVCVE